MDNQEYHKPVLYNETMENIIDKRPLIYVDCTLGGGGHTEGILQNSTEDSKVIAIDQDDQAIKFAKKRLEKYENKLQIFKDNFRNLDVLLLDDIQFFEKIFAQGEGKVQEEFFHTFNKLQESGKQIIMISDRYPKDIKNLSERLETRFVQGVTIEMQRPGYETRMQILENFTAMKNIKIEKNILEYIADNVSSNVRELEGVLTTIIARASLLNENITLQQAQDELANRVKTQKAKITAEKIIEVVSQEFTISVSDMKSKKRQAEIVNARQIAMFILKEMLDLNLTSIGGLFGGRDHSTVISSIRKIEEKITEDKIFKNQIDRIKQSITQ